MRIRLGDIVDVLATDEGVAALVDDQVLVLSPTAALILEQLHPTSWTDTARLEEPLVSAFGRPPGNTVLTIERVVSEMAERGLVTVKDPNPSARKMDKQ